MKVERVIGNSVTLDSIDYGTCFLWGARARRDTVYMKVKAGIGITHACGDSILFVCIKTGEIDGLTPEAKVVVVPVTAEWGKE